MSTAHPHELTDIPLLSCYRIDRQAFPSVLSEKEKKYAEGLRGLVIGTRHTPDFGRTLTLVFNDGSEREWCERVLRPATLST